MASTSTDAVSNGKSPCPDKPLVFLDTSVIIEYLRGDASAHELVSADESGEIRLAVNPIVLQELLVAHAASTPAFNRIRDHLRVLPLDVAKAEMLISRLRARQGRSVHSNDVLTMASAGECDFFVTRDQRMKDLVTAEKPTVLTPEEFANRLRAA